MGDEDGQGSDEFSVDPAELTAKGHQDQLMFSRQGHGSVALGFTKKDEAMGRIGWGWFSQHA